jgi:hypothetical protein
VECTEKYMNYAISVDTLYINVKYPRKDVFERWYRVIRGCESRELINGVHEGNFVVKGGKSGYKVGVWSHDIRAFLTDEVDELRGEGLGMGIWVQIGPKFLIDHPPGKELRKAAREFLSAIGVRGDWPINITRIDIALDLFDVELANQDIELWRNGWVGRAGISSIYFNPRSGQLETINIGSRRSPIYLRIYDKVAEALTKGDISYWWDVWKICWSKVTRLEWEVKPKKGGFEELYDFDQLSKRKIVELLNRLMKSGRLCIPNPNDSNNRRWEVSDFWTKVITAAEDWAGDITWPTSRLGKEFKGITEGYLRGLKGNLSGGMAKLSPENPNLFNMLSALDEYGFGLEKIQKDAEAKAEIIKRL